MALCKTIRLYHVYIDEPNTPYQGFFGYTKNAYLYEVGLVNITASGRNYTGDNNYVGGLLGYSDEGTVRNSYAAALVTGQDTGVGAIIGGANDVLSYYCYFNDSITGQVFAIGENHISRSAARASAEGNLSSGDMRMQAFVNTLNQGLVIPVWKPDYKDPINNGFPILIWQGNQNTGIEEAWRTGPLQLYPNPAGDYLFIQSDRPVDKVEIYNQAGICMMINENPGENIPVSGLSNGVYFVRIYRDGIPVTKKIIVKK